MSNQKPTDPAANAKISLPVIICDDHIGIRRGLQTILKEEGVNVVGLCGSVDELLDLARSHPTSIVILDLQIDGLEFPELVEKLREQSKDIKVVVYSARESAVTMGMCYEFGAVAFIPKNSTQDDIINALRFAADGERYFPNAVAPVVWGLSRDRNNIESRLSPREMELFLGYCRDPSIPKLAESTGLAEKSVQNALSTISKKLDAPRTTFLHLAQKCGLLQY